MKIKNIVLLLVTLFSQVTIAQEGLPVYTDYLTDNYYLIHPSMAGVANCSKIRMTGRQQWFGHEDAPKLLTLSLNGRIGDSQSAIGGILYTDKNGYHSQNGAYVTYAHHLMFSRSEADLNMLSFGLSVGFIQYKLDETTFFSGVPAIDRDRAIDGIVQSATELNIDFGFSYHYLDYYAHATIKNLLANTGINTTIGPDNGVIVTDNLRRYLISVGTVFGKYGSDWSYEPSLMFMYKDGTEEASIDFNAKAYKRMDFGKIWGGISYRQSLDGAQYISGTSVRSQKLQNITPIIGIDYNEFMFAYNYTHQINDVVFTSGGFHQFTLGYNFNCRREKYSCNCPAVN